MIKSNLECGLSYLKSQVRAVAEMDPLENAGSHRSAVSHLLWFGKRQNAPVRNVAAFHQSYPLQFRQSCKLHDGVVREVGTARQIDISDSVAQLDELCDACVCDA